MEGVRTVTSKRRKTKRSKDAVWWKETNKVKVESGGQSPKWRRETNKVKVK